MNLLTTSRTGFQTDLEWVVLEWEERGISRIRLGEVPGRFKEGSLVGPVPDWVRRLKAALIAHLNEGIPFDYSRVPLVYSGTIFSMAVRKACQEIPWGETRSYGDLAKAAGSPRAAQAVGQVMGSNPHPIVIPCHRVLGSGGRLHGYSAGSGLPLKRAILEREGALEGVESS